MALILAQQSALKLLTIWMTKKTGALVADSATRAPAHRRFRMRQTAAASASIIAISASCSFLPPSRATVTTQQTSAAMLQIRNPSE